MGKVSMPQGKGSQMHNRREYEALGYEIPDNIDVSKSVENITLVDKDIRQAYREIFGDALAAYNERQQRADRKIEDYYDHIQKSKNGEKLFYEDVVQWGKKEDFQTPETREKAKEALVRYVEGFEARNPNLKLIGAYIHMDEASPHLHFDYVPVAHGYSRGLSSRNSLDRAMKEMGFVPAKESRRENATKLWKDRERAVFGDICRSLGLEVEQEQKSTRKSLSVEEYKAARDEMLSEIQRERTQLLTTEEVKALQGEKTLLGGLKGVSFKEYRALKNTAEQVDTMAAEVKSMAAERDQALAQAARADRQAAAAYDDANRQLAEKIKEIEADRPSMKMQMEMVELRSKVDRLERERTGLVTQLERLKHTVDYLLGIVKEKLPEIYATIMQRNPTTDRTKPKRKQDWER